MAAGRVYAAEEKEAGKVRNGSGRPSSDERKSLRRQQSRRSLDEAKAKAIKSVRRVKQKFSDMYSRNMHFGNYDEFPRQSRLVKVFNPESRIYMLWEGLMAPFIAWAALVTPTELAFFADDNGWRCLGSDCASSAVLMFALNRFVDGYFLLDMAVVFNTAIFDPKRSRWILSHAAIARRYLRGWFALDVLSILPYELLDAGAFRSFRLLRALKVLRLLKLLRVARVGRLLHWWANRLHLSFKTLSVLRAALVIVVVLHWVACACRMVADPCFDRGDGSDCVVIRRGQGALLEYFSALHWSMRALTGDADAPILGVMILAVVAGLLGTIVTSFMIGEIAAILGNSDPASIEYKNTVDTLNAFAVEKKFPAEMQTKLREFFVSASSMFRNVYYRKMLLSLSPGLQQTIAKEEIGRFIMAIPFFRYAICRTLDIKRGTSVDVVQKGGPLRPATVDRPTTEGASFDVRYDDDFEPDAERRVAHERLVYFRGPECKRCVHEVQMMVRELSLHMQCVSFMANETMVHQGISWNDVLYIMVEGRALVYDQEDIRMATKEVVTDRSNNVIGKDVCTLLVDGKRRVRDYTAKTLSHSLVYSMSADEFTYMLNSAHYRILRKGVRAFGHWMIMKLNLKARWRDGSLEKILDTSKVERVGGGSDASDSDPQLDESPPKRARQSNRGATKKDVARVEDRVADVERGLRELSSKLDMLLTHAIRGTG